MFKFKGVSNVDMGVFAKEENFLGKAPVRSEIINVDGKNGAVYIEKGYEVFNSSLGGVTFIESSIGSSIGWLSGDGELEYKDKVTRIRFYDSYTVLNKRLPFSIGFTRDPFWYKSNDEFVEPTDNNILNEGTVYAQPLILLEKGTSDSCEFRINNVQFAYTFQNEDSVLIDCESCNATYNSLYRNRNLQIGFEFPKLMPGNNEIKVISGDALIKFKRKDVWL